MKESDDFRIKPAEVLLSFEAGPAVSQLTPYVCEGNEHQFKWETAEESKGKSKRKIRHWSAETWNQELQLHSSQIWFNLEARTLTQSCHPPIYISLELCTCLMIVSVWSTFVLFGVCGEFGVDLFSGFIVIISCFTRSLRMSIDLNALHLYSNNSCNWKHTHTHPHTRTVYWSSVIS